MKACRLCRRPATAAFLDLGMQPVSNRFLTAPDAAEYTHPLAIGYCRACGVVQLDQPHPAHEVRPRFDWISYNEPESHLDQLADDLRALPGLSPESVVCGISYKDDSTLRRLRERGFPRTWIADLATDLGVREPGAGIESIQDCLTPQTARAIVARHGRPDVVIMRHVLEHAHDIHRLLEALRLLVAPQGYLVFEMPDATRALERCDYSTVWEEHVFYFTPATLPNSLALCGFETAYFRSFPYTLEDSLVVAVRPAPAPRPGGLGPRQLAAETDRAERFLREFPRQRERYRAFFAGQRRERGPIAFLGAGHLSCALINYFDLADLVEFVVDDHPSKKGLFMPGSRLPIYGSEELVKRGVKLCCMSVRPEVEDKVIANNRPFLARGGAIASIFPDSRYALAV